MQRLDLIIMDPAISLSVNKAPNVHQCHHPGSAGPAKCFRNVDCHKTGPGSLASLSHEVPWQDASWVCAGRIVSPTRQSTNAPLNRTSDNSSKLKDTLFLDMLFAYIRLFPAMQYWGSPETYSLYIVRRIPPGWRRPRGRPHASWTSQLNSYTRVPTATSWLLAVNRQLWRRTQRSQPAMRYDDDFTSAAEPNY